jgi:hypothetical protein
MNDQLAFALKAHCGLNLWRERFTRKTAVTIGGAAIRCAQIIGIDLGVAVRSLGARIKQLRLQPILASLMVFLVLGFVPMTLAAVYSAIQSIFWVCRRSLQLERNAGLTPFTVTRGSRSDPLGHLEYCRAKSA